MLPEVITPTRPSVDRAFQLVAVDGDAWPAQGIQCVIAEFVEMPWYRVA
jgi:hypothetical protein